MHLPLHRVREINVPGRLGDLRQLRIPGFVDRLAWDNGNDDHRNRPCHDNRRQRVDTQSYVAGRKGGQIEGKDAEFREANSTRVEEGSNIEDLCAEMSVAIDMT